MVMNGASLLVDPILKADPIYVYHSIIEFLVIYLYFICIYVCMYVCMYVM
jgi:hypothetical protein